MVFKCKVCELKFKASDMKSVIMRGKVCYKCKYDLSRGKSAEWIKHHIFTVNSGTSNKYKTCIRCGLGTTSNDPEYKCESCDCIEFRDKLKDVR